MINASYTYADGESMSFLTGPSCVFAQAMIALSSGASFVQDAPRLARDRVERDWRSESVASTSADEDPERWDGLA